MTQPSNERWLPVVGYEGFYEVSDHGNVRSVTRAVPHYRGGSRTHRGKVLSPGTTKSGHQIVILSRHGKRATRLVHRLVLESFIGHAENDQIACHHNDVPADNRLENLRWDSHSENHRDRVMNGIQHNSVKSHCPRGHPYDSINTLSTTTATGIRRYCRTCKRMAMRKYRARQAMP